MAWGHSATRQRGWRLSRLGRQRQPLVALEQTRMEAVKLAEVTTPRQVVSGGPRLRGLGLGPHGHGLVIRGQRLAWLASTDHQRLRSLETGGAAP